MRKFASIIFALCLCILAEAQTQHVVRRGETAKNIADKYNITVEQLFEANPASRGQIHVGIPLTIPSQQTVTEVPSVSDNSDELETKPVVSAQQEVKTKETESVSESNFVQFTGGQDSKEDELKKTNYNKDYKSSQKKEFNDGLAPFSISMSYVRGPQTENTTTNWGLGWTVGISGDYYLNDQLLLTGFAGTDIYYNLISSRSYTDYNNNSNSSFSYWGVNLFTPVTVGLDLNGIIISAGAFAEYALFGESESENRVKTYGEEYNYKTTIKASDKDFTHFYYGMVFRVTIGRGYGVGLEYRQQYAKGSNEHVHFISLIF